MEEKFKYESGFDIKTEKWNFDFEESVLISKQIVFDSNEKIMITSKCEPNNVQNDAESNDF